MILYVFYMTLQSLILQYEACRCILMFCCNNWVAYSL